MALEEIIHYKRALVAERKQDFLRYQAASLTRSDRSLYSALQKNRTGFICEIKPSSPSQGLIRGDVNVVEVAKTYDNFADAISVLADEKYFGGSPNNVEAVSDAVSLPVLFKDIVVSPLQVYQARYYKADAILLMLSVLNDQDYIAAKKVADDLGLDIITEVHSPEEMKRAAKLAAKIIGINNRDLFTLAVDVSITAELKDLAPKNALLISESGYKNHRQILANKNLVDGFLVGTSLMKSPRIDLAVRELIFGRVKVCGLTNADDASLAYEHGAYYGGLNFYRQSPRLIDEDMATKIIRAAPLKYCGVFVNQELEEVARLARNLSLDYVQLHGDESETYAHHLKSALPSDCGIIKALRVKDHLAIPSDYPADLFLLDAFCEGSYAGTGKTFDWQKIASAELNNLALAGGINPSNAAQAQSMGACFIDVASGLEDDNPRQKSPVKMTQFFDNLRG